MQSIGVFRVEIIYRALLFFQKKYLLRNKTKKFIQPKTHLKNVFFVSSELR